MTHQEIYPDLETAILWAIALFSEAIREVDFNVITDPAEREGIAINTQPGYEFCEPGSTGVLWSNGVLREGAIEHLRVSTGGEVDGPPHSHCGYPRAYPCGLPVL